MGCRHKSLAGTATALAVLAALGGCGGGGGEPGTAPPRAPGDAPQTPVSGLARAVQKARDAVSASQQSTSTDAGGQ